jgi:hypothetical protein
LGLRRHHGREEQEEQPELRRAGWLRHLRLVHTTSVFRENQFCDERKSEQIKCQCAFAQFKSNPAIGSYSLPQNRDE